MIRAARKFDVSTPAGLPLSQMNAGQPTRDGGQRLAGSGNTAEVAVNGP